MKLITAVQQWWQRFFGLPVTHLEAGVKLHQDEAPSRAMDSITVTLTAEQSKKTAVAVKPPPKAKAAHKKPATKRKSSK